MILKFFPVIANIQSLHNITYTGGSPYVNMAQLQQLERCKAPFIAPPQVQETVSPLVVGRWTALLQTHPDKDFVTYILQGISKGFHIGYDYNKKAKRAASNLPSAYHNPEVVTRYIQEEVALGRMMGPLEPELAARVHVAHS